MLEQPKLEEQAPPEDLSLFEDLQNEEAAVDGRKSVTLDNVDPETLEEIRALASQRGARVLDQPKAGPKPFPLHLRRTASLVIRLNPSEKAAITSLARKFPSQAELEKRLEGVSLWDLVGAFDKDVTAWVRTFLLRLAGVAVSAKYDSPEMHATTRWRRRSKKAVS